MHLRITTIDGNKSFSAIDRLTLFEGGIIQINGLPSIQILNDYIRSLLTTHRGNSDMQQIHRNCTHQQFNRYKEDFNHALAQDSKISDLLARLVAELGWQETIYFDKPAVRFNPPLQYTRTGKITAMRSSTQAHRDTWGVNIMSQINFWSPLYPLSLNNTLSFYPGYWSRPLDNTTAQWSFEEFLQKKHQGYPTMPQALEQVSGREACKVLPDPDALLLFSAAHLHGTTPNRTPVTRINFETRCYVETDEHSKVGAKNIDTSGNKKCYRLFKQLTRAKA